MARFTDLAGPSPDPLPGFPGVYVRHSPLSGHRELTLMLIDARQPQVVETGDVSARLAWVQEELSKSDDKRGKVAALCGDLREICDVMAGRNDSERAEADRIYQQDRGLLQHLFNNWIVGEDGQPFSDVTGEEPEKDVGEVVAGSIIAATLDMIRDRKRGNVAPAGTS